MMQSGAIVVIVLHAMVHLLTCARSLDVTEENQTSNIISRLRSGLWLFGAVLFMITAVALYLEAAWWWAPSSIAVVISQYLIMTTWRESRLGTLPNAAIVVITLVGFASWHFHQSFQTQVELLAPAPVREEAQLTEADVIGLPDPVIGYLRFTGVIGRPRVRNFEVECSGAIRSGSTSPWMPFNSQQFNRVDEATRLFFMKANMRQLPVSGFHSFRNGVAFMDIRLLSLFRIQYQAGIEMGIAETVTFFNDMCVMAPATLVDERIKWLTVAGDSVLAEFRNNGIAVTAWLYFNEKGELINFVSDDRFATVDGKMKRLRWSTPLKDYKNFGGVRLASSAEAVYSYPEGDLCYGTFNLRSVKYNQTLNHSETDDKLLTDAGD